jgi:Chlorophyll A-B binding protein
MLLLAIQSSVNRTPYQQNVMQTASEFAEASAATKTVQKYNGFAPAYNGADRNAWLMGWTPQQELWNGRLAMLGFVAYLLWDTAG